MNELFSESPIIGYGLILFLLGLIYFEVATLAIFIIIAGILAFMLYFYRAPEGVPEHATIPSNVVLAPSYGTVKAIRHEDDYVYVAIFLSPVDVHQQYYPVNGIVRKRVYDFTGKYDVAFNINKSRHNEKKIHVIQTEHGVVLVTQLAGFLVRAIVSDEDINVKVKAGKRFGMIKFGSRVDIAIPRHNGFKLSCKIGDKLTGGREIIGKWTTEA